MHALIADELLHARFGFGESVLDCLRVALSPTKDMIVMAARAVRAFVFVFKVFAQQRASSSIARNGIDQRRQFLVFDFDQRRAVGGGVAISATTKATSCP